MAESKAQFVVPNENHRLMIVELLLGIWLKTAVIFLGHVDKSTVTVVMLGTLFLQTIKDVQQVLLTDHNLADMVFNRSTNLHEESFVSQVCLGCLGCA